MPPAQRGPLLVKLGKYLRDKKITYEAFGKRIGRDHTAVSRYVNGKRLPNRVTMRNIVDATGGAVTANDFLDEMPKPNRRRVTAAPGAAARKLVPAG